MPVAPPNVDASFIDWWKRYIYNPPGAPPPASKKPKKPKAPTKVTSGMAGSSSSAGLVIAPAKNPTLSATNGNSVLAHHVQAVTACVLDPEHAEMKSFPDGLGIDGNMIRSTTTASFSITANSNGVSVYPTPAQLIVRSGATYDMSAGTTTTTDALYTSAINVADVESVRCLGMKVKINSQSSLNSSYPKVICWEGRRLVHTSRTAIGTGLPTNQTRTTVMSAQPQDKLELLWIPGREHDFCPFAKASTYTASNDLDGYPLLDRPAMHIDIIYSGSLTQIDITVVALWDLKLAQTALYRAAPIPSPNSALAKDASLNLLMSVYNAGGWYRDSDTWEDVADFFRRIFNLIGGSLGYKICKSLAEGGWLPW